MWNSSNWCANSCAALHLAGWSNTLFRSKSMHLYSVLSIDIFWIVRNRNIFILSEVQTAICCWRVSRVDSMDILRTPSLFIRKWLHSINRTENLILPLIRILLQVAEHSCAYNVLSCCFSVGSSTLFCFYRVFLNISTQANWNTFLKKWKKGRYKRPSTFLISHFCLFSSQALEKKVPLSAWVFSSNAFHSWGMLLYF